MTSREIIGVVLLCVSTSAAVFSNMLLTAMIGEINRERSEGNRISYFGFTFSKFQRILREYRECYPTGKLHIYFWCTFVVAMAALIGAAVSLGII
jgi:hypothetical protein